MTLTFAVLGDSIAYGQGASRTADTAGARLAAELTAAGTRTELRVFAVPGARSDDLVAQVRAASDWHPDIALIIIGANDLTHFVPPQQAAADLGEAVETLRAGGTQVVVAPAPDLSVMSWIPQQLRTVVQAGSALLRQAQTRAALAAGARVANVEGTTSAQFGRNASLFSGDRFHPSSAGYALIAAALSPAIHAAAADALSQTG
ncbi:MAG: family lipolytic protein [Jatrophihabitans sp.]|jgi:lysophospholipase L1-like esterase|nr:family lipolytic protein [Jatrophihabitans sp.]MCW2656947.1 family lipolytic protein [Jatrophihabitans sp.]MDT4931782.1 hypothetical protein [Pseudonocardiales bacterium]MDT4948942.1 hypothetical protein [Pseudonocardiales bacterium]